MSHGHGALKNIQFRLSEQRSKRHEKKKVVGGEITKIEYNFAKVSDEELAKIKKTTRKKAKVRNRRELLLFIIILFAIVISATLLLY